MSRQLRPCGTSAAYRRHLRHGEAACDACLTAERDRQRARNGGGPRPDPQPCGTMPAYGRHLRAGEKPCGACLDAWAVYMKGRRAAKRGAK